MGKSDIKADEIIKLLEEGKSVQEVKTIVSSTPDEWYRFSSKAYAKNLKKDREQRSVREKQKTIGITSEQDVSRFTDLNDVLADHALLLPVFSTMGDFDQIQSLIARLPSSEPQIIKELARVNLHPKFRLLQRKGRFENFEYFKPFVKMIDAAQLSYYRTNFIACYMTLCPIVEGIIIRWMGFQEGAEKPDFEVIRGFFKNSSQRQPCPGNAVFHDINIKACDKILNNHFYRPTSSGDSYNNFNRHLASHLLNDNQFATQQNCVRLFILLDAMTQVFLYEKKITDPRFIMGNAEISKDLDTYFEIIRENIRATPENQILGTSLDDLMIL